tara:strand:- start:231 stop:533 length:303 start_codon:yes stop_codon:yes gene_type:complete
MLKLITAILILLLFNGCIQGSALFGPAVTVASSGNITQAGLSYVSSQTVTKITGKTPAANIKNFLEKNKDDEDQSANAKNFFTMVKEINKKSGIKNLANQ